LGEYQTHGYKCIMDYLRNRGGNVTDKFGQTKVMPTFENMETFGYTYLEKPIQSLDIVYPSPELDAIITNTQPGDANLETIVQNMVGKKPVFFTRSLSQISLLPRSTSILRNRVNCSPKVVA